LNIEIVTDALLYSFGLVVSLWKFDFVAVAAAISCFYGKMLLVALLNAKANDLIQ